MKKLLLMFIPLLLVSCSDFMSAGLEVHSFTDPDYKDIKFNKIMIHVVCNDFVAQNNLENYINKIFIGQYIESVPSSQILLPTRQYSYEEQVKCLSDSGISAVLMITVNYASYIQYSTLDNREIEKPYVEIGFELKDYIKDKIAWICKSNNGGNVLNSIKEMSDELYIAIADKLLSDRIIAPFKPVPKGSNNVQ